MQKQADRSTVVAIFGENLCQIKIQYLGQWHCLFTPTHNIIGPPFPNARQLLVPYTIHTGSHNYVSLYFSV